MFENYCCLVENVEFDRACWYLEDNPGIGQRMLVFARECWCVVQNDGVWVKNISGFLEYDGV